MKTKFFLLAGLPRSGNTLLASILNQNPEIYASPLSPVADYLAVLHKTASKNNHIHATMDFTGTKNSFEKFTSNYYENINKPIIFDREKTWAMPDNFFNALTYIDSEIKVIFTTRDLPEILASIILVMGKRINEQMDKDKWVWKSHLTENDNKCDYLMSPLWEIDKLFSSYLTIKNYPEHIHVVEYENLIAKPQETMTAIYEFLGINNYNHDFNNIERLETYFEENINMPNNLHEVRPQLNKTSPKVEDVLSDYAINKYRNH
jgi:sulfotransferase